jgi:hypothetical protein
VHDIEKGNMNDILKSTWLTMKKKGKVEKIFEDYRIFILFCILGVPYYQDDTLGEFVKYKSLKTLSKPKFPEKLDISRFRTGFQRHLPETSGPQPEHVRVSDTPMDRFP